MRHLETWIEMYPRSSVKTNCQIFKELTQALRPACHEQRDLARSKIALLMTRRDDGWWSQPGSNRRPSGCKPDALPAELWPPAKWAEIVEPSRTRSCWWVWEELNLRPHPYQGCALTN